MWITIKLKLIYLDQKLINNTYLSKYGYKIYVSKINLINFLIYS